jgi:hypothetical protein
VGGLKALHAAGGALCRPNGEPFEVPLELLQYLDDGGNPDVFIADVMRSCQAANEASRAKVEAFREWQRGVAEQLEGANPALAAEYQALRRGGAQGGGSAAPAAPAGAAALAPPG